MDNLTALTMLKIAVLAGSMTLDDRLKTMDKVASDATDPSTRDLAKRMATDYRSRHKDRPAAGGA